MSDFPCWDMPIGYELHIPMDSQHRTFWACWHRTEGGNAKNNPLNCVMPMPGSTYYNYLNKEKTVGVQNYPNKRTGISAHIKTLQEDRYSAVLKEFRKARPDWRYLAQAIQASGFGTDSTLLIQIMEEERLI